MRLILTNFQQLTPFRRSDAGSASKEKWMTQTFQTNITVMQDADGTMGIFTVHTENGKKVLTMAEYIKREAAIDAVTEVYYNKPDVNLSGEKFEAAINGILATDVAPVVRCKNCKHYDLGVCLKIYSDGNMHPEAWQSRKPDDFCADGERKEGADG